MTRPSNLLHAARMALCTALRRAPRIAACLALACAIVPPAVARGQMAITLQQAIDMAQRQGPQARAAFAARDAARQHDRAFNARLLPQLFLGGTVPQYSRAISAVPQPDGTILYTPLNQTNGNLGVSLSQQVPLTGGTLSVQSLLSQTQLSGSQQYKSYTTTPFQVQLTQPIFRPNEQRWSIREEELSIDIADKQYLEAREQIAVSTTGAFYDFYSARLNLNNSVANAAVNDTLYKLNTGRYEVGKIGENDLLQSELALLRARAAVDQAKLEFDRSLAALRIAVNVPAGTPLDVVVSSDVPPDFPVDTLVAVQQALRNQSQIQANAYAETVARQRISEAQLGGGPGATVVASYGLNQTASVLNQAYRSPLEAQAFSINVQTPLFLWGAHSADVQSAESSREQVVNNNRLSVANVEQGARFAALGFLQSRRGLIISAKADTVGSKRYEVAYNRYTIGRINYADLYLAQQEKDAALQSYVLALRTYWTAYYQLRAQTLYDFEKGQPIR
jgi:outer membrane protein